MLTIIDSIGWKKEHIAAFIDNERVELKKIDFNNVKSEIESLKKKYLRSDMRYMELKCSNSFREFVSVSDFPMTLSAYFK